MLCFWADTYGARKEMLHRRKATDNFMGWYTLKPFENKTKRFARGKAEWQVMRNVAQFDEGHQMRNKEHVSG